MDRQLRTTLVHPISIFAEINNANSAEEREKLARGLKALKESFPEGFKMGAAAVGGDSFFHSVAQGLDELEDQGKGSFSVTSLRRGVEDCAGQGSCLDLTLPEHASRAHRVMWGRQREEAKVMCKQQGIKMRVKELRDDDCGLHVVKDKIGKGQRVVHLVVYRSHCVPLLRNISKHVKKRLTVSREQVYGEKGTIPLVDLTCDQTDIVEEENPTSDGKCRRSDTLSNNVTPKKTKEDVIVTHKEKAVTKRDLMTKHGKGFKKRIIVPRGQDDNDEVVDFTCDMLQVIDEESPKDGKRGRSATLSNSVASRNEMEDVILPHQEKAVTVSDLKAKHRKDMNRRTTVPREQVEGDDGSLLLVNLTCEGSEIVYEKSHKADGKRRRSASLLNCVKSKKSREDVNVSHQDKSNTVSCIRAKQRRDLKRRLTDPREHGDEGSIPVVDLTCDQAEIVEEEDPTTDGKRKRSATLSDSVASRKAREDVNVLNKNRSVTQSHLTYEQRKDLLNMQVQFAKSIGKTERTTAYREFLDFSRTKEGINCLDNLRKSGINPTAMSSILHGAGLGGVKAFRELYGVWFDEHGNKSQYLQSIEKAGIKLNSISCILSSAGSKGAQAFIELNDLWFDKEGTPNHYLKTLEKEKISLTTMSCILNRSKLNIGKAFRDLFNLWFDREGSKTRYLKTLERERISLQNISSILNGTGSKAAEAFKDLYDLWFNSDGNKTRYLKSLEKQKINLSNMTTILGKAGSKAAVAFKDLYDLWFNEDGSKTRYLLTLEKEEIKLSNISTILNGTGAKGPEAFKELYNLWFKVDGSKSRYLLNFQKGGMKLGNMLCILDGTGTKAPETFKELHNLLFEEDGSKTRCLETLEREKIKFDYISSILRKTGAKAPTAFSELYNLWFDKDGNKTEYLMLLEQEGIYLVHVCSLLKGAGSKAPKAFIDLFERRLHKKWK